MWGGTGPGCARAGATAQGSASRAHPSVLDFPAWSRETFGGQIPQNNSISPVCFCSPWGGGLSQRLARPGRDTLAHPWLEWGCAGKPGTGMVTPGHWPRVKVALLVEHRACLRKPRVKGASPVSPEAQGTKVWSSLQSGNSLWFCGSRLAGGGDPACSGSAHDSSPTPSFCCTLAGAVMVQRGLICCWV